MTGNNKVWRAPLAALASVAMLATMGVAVATANADSPVSVEKPHLYLKASASASAVEAKQSGTADFYLTVAELNANKVSAPKAGAHFTGWYKSDGTAYKPGTALPQGAVLTAHWSQTPIIFNFTGAVNSKYSNTYGSWVGDSTVSTANSQYVLLAKGDKIAAWQLPQDKVADYRLDDWEVVEGALKPQAVSYDTLRNTAAEDWVNEIPAAYWKQNDAFGKNQYVTLKAKSIVGDGTQTSAVHKVTFNAAAYGYGFVNTGLSSVSKDVKTGEPTSLRVDASDYAAAKGDRKVTKWTDVTSDGYVFDANAAVDRDWNLKPLESALTFTVNYYNGSELAKTEEVEPNGTATAPSLSRDGFTLKGWSLSTTDETNLFDFSKTIDRNYNLYAVWQSAGVAVTFDPVYDLASPIKVTFADGDYFAAPSATRDGYELVGWYTTVFGKEVKSDYYEGSKLRIVEGSKLQYLDAHGDHGDDATGEKSDWVDLPTAFTAKWVPTKETALDELEAKAYATDHNGTILPYGQGDSEKYTKSSWSAYTKDYQEYLLARKAAASDGLTKSEIAKLYAQLQDAQGELVQKTNVEVVRLRKGAKFLYSSDAKEQSYWKNNGWIDEGVAFYAVSEQGPVASKSVPVYRLRNLTNGDHLLSTDTNEVSVLEANGWASEGVLFYAPQGAADSVKRFWKAGSEHLYTADLNEYKYQTTKGGWTGDDTVFVASKTNVK
ncbi:InlB B-repeat-containing protein [Bifidobacterium callitrichos]|nr:InlB B-repeat-containing protein [Bifidobacterium callitrichos]